MSQKAEQLLNLRKHGAAIVGDSLVSVPTAGSEGQETSENAHGASCSEAMSKGDPDAHQLWDFFSTSVLDSPFKHIHLVALVLYCIYLIEKLFALRVEALSGRKRARVVAAAIAITGSVGPLACFLLWLARYKYIRCLGSHATFLFDAFDAPAWTGPILVIVILYSIFSAAIHILSVPDFRKAANDYIDARARIHMQNMSPAQRAQQVGQVQDNYIHQAVDRFRHDSKLFKIIIHAFFKTFAFFAFSASASYLLIFFLASIIAIFFVFAAIRRVSSGRFFPRLWNTSAFTKCSCKLLALVICFSLPIFIQQGDIDSRSNLNPQLADQGCIFFNSLFNRVNSLDANRGDLFCDSTFWSDHLIMYFNGTYPSVLYRCPLRVSRSILYAPPQHALQQHRVTLKCRYTLPVLALVNLIGSFYTDDFALKNRRVLQYSLGIANMRKCTKLSYVFREDKLHLPLLSPMNILAVAQASIIVIFTLLDPKLYFRVQCRLRPPLDNTDDAFQFAFSICLAGLCIFGFTVLYFHEAIVVVRLYRAHYLDGSRLLKALFKPKKLEHSADAFTAKSFLEWEQTYSVLNYCRSGLNVICAFQTTSLSILFVACVAGVVSTVLRGVSESCTEAVTSIILSIASASFLLPILFYAFMASRFDITAAYALNDLANQCKSLRERRDLTCFVWDHTESDQLKQRLGQWAQEQQPDSRSRRSLEINSVYDNMTSGGRGLNLLVSHDMFDKIAGKMTGALTPLPQTPHFQKQLLGQSVDKVGRPSFLDHVETLSPADLLALEAVCSRLSRTLHHFPHPCRVLGLDVDVPFMVGLFGVVSSFVGSLLRLALEGRPQ